MTLQSKHVAAKSANKTPKAPARDWCPGSPKVVEIDGVSATVGIHDAPPAGKFKGGLVLFCHVNGRYPVQGGASKVAGLALGAAAILRGDLGEDAIVWLKESTGNI